MGLESIRESFPPAPAPVTAPWPRPLISPAELAARFDRAELRLIECGIAYHMLPDRSDFRVKSAEPLYIVGHNPGAVFADPIAALSDRASGLRFTMPDPASLAQAFGGLGVGDGTFVVLYCRDHNVFAARLWWMLRAIGFDDAAVLDGGFARWTQEGRHVTAEVPRHPPAHLAPRPCPGLFVGKGTVRAALADSRITLVNALSAEQHAGRGGVTYERPGRIPGSVSVPARSLTDPVSHAFLPSEPLRAIFEAVGVLHPDPAGDGPIVIYCGAGIAASSDAFVLTLLGARDVAVYDGSLEEWARDPACPMESGPVAS